jgi:hypothetical protein
VAGAMTICHLRCSSCPCPTNDGWVIGGRRPRWAGGHIPTEFITRN